MDFLDFEKIIRNSYPYLIESYVSQYGEKYRERIVDALERVRYCFFVTPSNLTNYVEKKVKEDFMRAIIDSYEDIGIDTSTIKIGKSGLEIVDKKVKAINDVLFSNLNNVGGLEKEKIFVFGDKYDDLDMNDPIFRERISILEKLRLKNPRMPIKDYIGTSDYKRAIHLLKNIFKIFHNNLKKYWQDNYKDYLKYAYELNKKIDIETERYIRAFFKIIKDQFSEEDQALIDDPNFDLRQLKDYFLYFENNSEDDGYKFEDGVLLYFAEEYDKLLLDPDTSLKIKEEIVENRFKYFNYLGFNTKIFDVKKLFCDWSSIDAFKGLLPDKDKVKKLITINDKLNTKYLLKVSSLCVINDYELKENDPEISTIYEDGGHSCSICRHGEIDFQKPISVVCLCPFTPEYNLFDIVIDHELRHAIETSIKKAGARYFVKVGVDGFYYSKDKADDFNNFYSDYSERMTHLLSVEATRKRWHKGQFILSDRFALKTTYPVSIYDYDFDNLGIVLKRFRKRLIEAQISSDPDEIFDTIPSSELIKINDLITDHSLKTTMTLKVLTKKIQHDLRKRKVEKK